MNESAREQNSSCFSIPISTESRDQGQVIIIRKLPPEDLSLSAKSQ